MDDEQIEEPIDDDWENRILCSDGNCIGIVGPDGRCKACGKPSDNPIRQPFTPEINIETAVDDDAGIADNPPPPEPEESAPPMVPGDEWDNRILCIDGNCIGVIGPDGRCKECGKPYEQEPD